MNRKIIKDKKFTLSMRDKVIKLKGEIDIPYPDKIMRPFFEEIHQMVLAEKIMAVKVNVQDLTFMNSSGIKEIMTWVLKQKILPDRQKYRIVFQCNPTIGWHEISFTSIMWLNKEYIAIENNKN